MSNDVHYPHVKPKRVLDEKHLAAILMCLLSSIVLLGSSSGPPLVAISAIPAVEDGTTVKVVGVVVDIRLYDSGAEGIIVADLDDGTVVKVVSTPGIKHQPSAYARIGDELQVEGEVSSTQAACVIFAGSDNVLVVRESELVLTVKAISSNWFLFEGDVVRIKGVLEQTGLGVGLRLYDCSDGCSIAVLPDDLDLDQFVGLTVTLTATLHFDHWLSALTLVPSYATAG
jgi:hypothetical protein